MMLYPEYMCISVFCLSIDQEEDLNNYHMLF